MEGNCVLTSHHYDYCGEWWELGTRMGTSYLGLGWHYLSELSTPSLSHQKQRGRPDRRGREREIEVRCQCQSQKDAYHATTMS